MMNELGRMVRAVCLEKRTYTPDQIKSYRFDNGKYYLSGFSVDYEMKDHIDRFFQRGRPKHYNQHTNT